MRLKIKNKQKPYSHRRKFSIYFNLCRFKISHTVSMIDRLDHKYCQDMEENIINDL